MERYRTLALQALKSPTDLQDDNMKLRGFIVDEKLAFERNMKKKGHLYNFLEIGEPQTNIRQEVDDDSDSDATQKVSSDPFPNPFSFRSDNLSPSVSHPSVLATHDLTIQPHRPRGAAVRRRGLYTPSQSPPREQKPTVTQSKRSPLYNEIRKQIDTNRGEELPGMLNPAVLKPLLNKQTSNWQTLGEEYLERLVTMTTDVALKIFDKACQDAGAT